MNNTYIEYEHKLSNGKSVKAYKGYTVCPNCQSKFELDTTMPELFGKAKCMDCFKKEDKNNA